MNEQNVTLLDIFLFHEDNLSFYSDLFLSDSFNQLTCQIFTSVNFDSKYCMSNDKTSLLTAKNQSHSMCVSLSL
jgi:hypothetical protein